MLTKFSEKTRVVAGSHARHLPINLTHRTVPCAIKSLIQVGGVVAGIGAGAAIAAVTGPTVVGVVAFAGLSYVTGIVIDEACTALMNKAGVE